MKLNQKIEIKSLKKSAYPSKTQLNLAMKEKSSLNLSRLLPVAIVVILFLGGFIKFGILDRMDQVNLRQQDLGTLQQEAQALQLATAKYDEISEAYVHYSSDWMTAEQKEIVPCAEILNLIEKHIVPEGKVLNVSTSGKFISVNVGNIDLEIAARFVEDLYLLPVISDVRVYTAESENPSSKQLKINFVITMMPQAMVANAEGGTKE